MSKEISQYDVRRFLTDHEQLDFGLIEIIVRSGRPISFDAHKRYEALIDKLKREKLRTESEGEGLKHDGD